MVFHLLYYITIYSKTTPHKYKIYNVLNSVSLITQNQSRHYNLKEFFLKSDLCCHKNSNFIHKLCHFTPESLFKIPWESFIWRKNTNRKDREGSLRPVTQSQTWAIRSQPWDTKSKWTRELWLVWQRGSGEMEGEEEERRWQTAQTTHSVSIRQRRASSHNQAQRAKRAWGDSCNPRPIKIAVSVLTLRQIGPWNTAWNMIW